MITLAAQMVSTNPPRMPTTIQAKAPPSSRLEAAFQGEKMTSAILQVVRITWAINEITS